MADRWDRGTGRSGNEGTIAAIDLASDAVTEAKIADGAVTSSKVSLANSQDGTIVANVASENTEGGLPVLHRVTATTLTGDQDVTLTHKTLVIDVWAIARGAGGVGDTIIVKEAANVITDTMDLNVADGVIARAASIDTANSTIAAGGTLRVTGASAVTADVFVLGIRIA